MRIKTSLIIFSIVFFICSCNAKSKAEIDKVIVTQQYHDSFYNKTYEIELYNGSPDEIGSLVKEIEKAKTISVLWCIKEALKEGKFCVQFYEKSDLKLNWNIYNSQNAYDEINRKYKKISVIEMIPHRLKYWKGDGSFREDFFINFTDSAMLKAFGPDNTQYEFIYDEKVFPKIEIYPDYRKYLTEEDYGKKVKVIKWIIQNKTLVIWFIHDNDNFKSFSSIEFSDEIKF